MLGESPSYFTENYYFLGFASKKSGSERPHSYLVPFNIYLKLTTVRAGLSGVIIWNRFVFGGHSTRIPKVIMCMCWPPNRQSLVYQQFELARLVLHGAGHLHNGTYTLEVRAGNCHFQVHLTTWNCRVWAGHAHL